MSHQSTWSHSWSSDWKDSKWTSKSNDWPDPAWGSQTSSWRSSDPPKMPPLDNRPSGNSSPPRTAFSERRPPRRRKTSPPRSSSVQELPPGHVSLVDPSLKDEEWRQTVQKCLNDPTRTKAANEVAVHERPQLANTIDIRARDFFIDQMRRIDPEIPPTRLQSLIHVLAASHLLSEVDFNRVEVLVLPNTSQRAMVVRLSHIPRFREKPPFLGQASHSYAMLHGTNIIGAKNCLAEALVDFKRVEVLVLPNTSQRAMVDPSKESVDDPEHDRAPEDVDRLRSWSRRGGNEYDEEDDP
eukprot:s7_g63.t1